MPSLGCLLLLFLPGLRAAPEVLQVATIEVEGFSMLDMNGKWFGLVPELVEQIGKELNFVPNFTTTKPSDGRFGQFEEATGNWSGLMGEVTKGKVAFAAAPLTATTQREEHVDFSHEFLDTGLVVVIKKPEWVNPVARSAAFFLSVYDAGAWAAVVLVFMLTSVLIYVNDRYNPREFRAREAEHNSQSAALSHNLLMQMNDFSLFGSLFFVVSTGCFQGYRRAPQSLVGRNLSVCWWIFTCLFATAYVAGLLCTLVASRGKLERQFVLNDFSGGQMGDSTTFSGFVPIWIANGSTDQFFRASQDPVFHSIYSQYIDAVKKDPTLKNIDQIENLLERIKNDGKYFGVVESVMADYYSRTSGCDVLTAGSLLNDRSYAFAFPHGSNLTRQVNVVLLRLLESGFVRTAYRKYFLRSNIECNRAMPPETTVTMSLAGEEMAKMFRNSLPITLRSFSGPVLFYFVGLLLSAVTVLGDIYIFTRYERYRQGSQPFRDAPEQHEPEEPEPSFGALTFNDDQRLASRPQEM